MRITVHLPPVVEDWVVAARDNCLLKTLALLICISASATGASAAPMMPLITGHALNFGANNTDGVVEYQTNGMGDDTLLFTRQSSDQEVTTYWPSWPAGPPMPVWNESDMSMFGGDFHLDLILDGADAVTGGEFDVSLTGSGILQVFGSLSPGTTGMLWQLTLDQVSLYGNSDSNTFILEGIGEITGGLIPNDAGILGDPGSLRGHLDFDTTWLTPLYQPSDDIDSLIEATYSGQTGLLPEPGTLTFLLSGFAALFLRGRRAETHPHGHA